MTLLPAKLKLAGYATHMAGKGHLGARTPANLMINRGCDYGGGVVMSTRPCIFSIEKS